MTPETATDPVAIDLTITYERAARSGTKLNLKAMLGDEPVHIDQVDIAKKAERQRFAADLAREAPGVDLDDVERQLLSIAEEISKPKAGTARGASTSANPEAPYLVADGCLCRLVKAINGDASLPAPLCNFNARITEEVVRDDGVEQSRLLRLEGTLASGEPLPPIDVATAEFGLGNWPLQFWGPRAIVNAGPGTKDHLRVAIQSLSGPAPRRTVYAYTGWARIDGAWAYLHAGGAIGPIGPLENVSIDLPDALMRYRLPDPPSGDALREAVRASRDLGRGLAPDRVILPLLMTVYRSVLPGADCTVFACGPTGTFKTELAALMQQHFGAELDAKHLPANWSSTGNALEAIAFAAKDALLVVDDFAPTGSTTDINRLHREAERLIRAQGNRSGRQRLRSDASQRPTKPPRGLLLSTGEDVPRGQSVRARILLLEVEKGDVEKGRLTECQRAAVGGVYAAAMAGYLRWLAASYEPIRDALKAEAERLREEITVEMGEGQHRRTPTAVADLLAGFAPFLRFAQEVGAISLEEAEALGRRCRAALLGVAAEQAAHQEDSDPCDRYLALLRSVLSSGRAHVAGPGGERPDDRPQACGWRPMGNPADPAAECHPQGKLIGWIEGADLYIDPDAAFAEVQRLAAEQGEPLTIGQRTVHKRLHERKFLASIDAGRKKLLVRRILGDTRRNVLHLRAEQVLDLISGGPIGPTGPSTPQPSESSRVAAGPRVGPSGRPADPEGPTMGPYATPEFAKRYDADGPDGPIGPLFSRATAPPTGEGTEREKYRL